MASNLMMTGSISARGGSILFPIDSRGAVVNVKVIATTGNNTTVGIAVTNNNPAVFTTASTITAKVERGVVLLASPDNVLMRGAISLPANASLIINSDNAVDVIVSGVSGEV